MTAERIPHQGVADGSWPVKRAFFCMRPERFGNKRSDLVGFLAAVGKCLVERKVGQWKDSSAATAGCNRYRCRSRCGKYKFHGDRRARGVAAAASVCDRRCRACRDSSYKTPCHASTAETAAQCRADAWSDRAQRMYVDGVVVFVVK